MAWRLAKSLQVLRSEVRTLHPGTTVWDIGGAAHRASWSDHNPNAADVVCAIDVLGNGGLNLGEFAEHVRTSGHRAAKYVIYKRRIASRSQGWRWRAYYGSNPHDRHVHVSVGIGPDGRSTGPYDDTSPWGLLEDDMPTAKEVAKAVWSYPLSSNPQDVEDKPAGAWQRYGRLAVVEGEKANARLAAIQAKLGGDDVEATVQRLLDEYAERARAERQAELGELAALVQQAQSGELDAAEVVDELARRLAGA